MIHVTRYLIFINNRESVFMAGNDMVTVFANIWNKKRERLRLMGSKYFKSE